MQELRFVAVSEDGSYAVLAIPGRSGRYILPIDERLRAVALGQTSRLAQYEIEVESPLRPKEIQARIRAGETAEEIADAAGIPVERVRWFEGPVLAERAYIADQAQAGSVRRAGDSSGPGPRLGDIVTARLSAAGTDPADGQWDSRKRGDGNWQVALTFPSGGRLHVAEWVFDPRRRHVMPDDDNAARLSLPESELPAEPVPMPGEATVTPIASRLGAAAGMGGGSVGGPGVSRFRPDRSVIPDRSLGVDRSLVDRPLPPSAPAPERTGGSDRSAVSDRFPAPEWPPTSTPPSAPSTPVPPPPEQQDRPDHQNRAAHRDYVEFPESAPYRIPMPTEEPPAHVDPAQESAARRPQAEPPTYREAEPEQRTYRDPVPEADHYRAPAPQPPAYRDPAPEPAAQVPAVQVSPAAAVEDPERVRPTAPRPVVFEDPWPAFTDEQPGLPENLAPVRPAPTTAPQAAEPTHPAVTSPAAQAPPVGGSSREPSVTSSADAVTPTQPETPAGPSAAAEPAVAAVSASPAAEAPAAPAEPEPKADAAAASAPGEDQSARPRSGAKKNAKGRRSSVPSWDEIMLGSSRQRE
jgi:hypothetical protein